MQLAQNKQYAMWLKLLIQLQILYNFIIDGINFGTQVHFRSKHSFLFQLLFLFYHWAFIIYTNNFYVFKISVSNVHHIVIPAYTTTSSIAPSSVHSSDLTLEFHRSVVAIMNKQYVNYL